MDQRCLRRVKEKSCSVSFISVPKECAASADRHCSLKGIGDEPQQAFRLRCSTQTLLAKVIPKIKTSLGVRQSELTFRAMAHKIYYVLLCHLKLVKPHGGVKMTGFMTTREAAEKWGITIRQVQNHCKRGLIKGAQKAGNNWMIPEGTRRPKYTFICETDDDTEEPRAE